MASNMLCILLLTITTMVYGPAHAAQGKEKEEMISLREVQQWFDREMQEMVTICDQRMKDIEALARCEKCPDPRDLMTKEDQCECPQQISTEQPETRDCIPNDILTEHCRVQVASMTTNMPAPAPMELPWTQNVYRDCQDALKQGQTASGVYRIMPEGCNSFAVYCDQEIDGGGWVVFQQRKDGNVNFYRTWESYREGYGNLMGEMWLGNKFLHDLTKQNNTELKVELTSMEGEVEYANYSSFSIEDEANKFRLHVSGYTGGDVPGDSLSGHNGQQFSTRDEDNDSRSSSSCASSRHGAWWYRNCAWSNLNGQYDGSGITGVYWNYWKHYTSLRGTRMMVRRRT